MDLRPEHEILAQHVRGERVDQVLHMCPECGIHPRAFCPTCLGAGVVTEQRLAQWQLRVLDDAQV